MRLSDLHSKKKIAQKLFKKPKKDTPEEIEEKEQEETARRKNKQIIDLTVPGIMPNRGPNTDLKNYSNIGGTTG